MIRNFDTMPQTPTIHVKCESLTKRYPGQSQPALEDVTFAVKAGEKIGIIGANGSGKTTLFRLILNLIRPDAGKISIMGDPDPENKKAYTGFVPEHQEGLENFTPAEILTFAGKMSKMSSEQIRIRSEELLRWSGLQNKREELIAGFSKGMRQQLLLSAALIHQPTILILDEPMSGLDPGSQKDFSRLLQELAAFTILYASHHLAEIEQLCRRIFIFQSGRLIQDLRLPKEEQIVTIIKTVSSMKDLLKNFGGIRVEKLGDAGENIQIKIQSNSNDLQKLIFESQKQNIQIHQIQSKSLLEDVYDQFVKKA